MGGFLKYTRVNVIEEHFQLKVFRNTSRGYDIINGRGTTGSSNHCSGGEFGSPTIPDSAVPPTAG